MPSFAIPKFTVLLEPLWVSAEFLLLSTGPNLDSTTPFFPVLRLDCQFASAACFFDRLNRQSLRYLFRMPQALSVFRPFSRLRSVNKQQKYSGGSPNNQIRIQNNLSCLHGSMFDLLNQQTA